MLRIQVEHRELTARERLGVARKRPRDCGDVLELHVCRRHDALPSLEPVATDREVVAIQAEMLEPLERADPVIAAGLGLDEQPAGGR